MHFGACYRLAKMFKLNNLLQQFNKHLFSLVNPEDVNEQIELNEFTEQTEMPINDTDIFCKLNKM